MNETPERKVLRELVAHLAFSAEHNGTASKGEPVGMIALRGELWEDVVRAAGTTAEEAPGLIIRDVIAPAIRQENVSLIPPYEFQLLNSLARSLLDRQEFEAAGAVRTALRILTGDPNLIIR